MKRKKVLRSLLFGFLSAAMVGGMSRPASAEPTVSFSQWLKEIKFSGDLRLREEYFDRKTEGQVDRSRLRFRLRLNADLVLSPTWMVRAALASGTGEQLSTNQSFDNLSSEKGIWIDKAYAAWQPCRSAKLLGGKMDNPLWRVYASDAIWDTDFNPEGGGQSLEAPLGPVRIFANALQMVGDEDSGANTETGEQADQWEFSEQVGLEAKLPGESKLRVAFANHYWKNENQGTLSQVTVNDGNRRVAGVILNNFNVNEYTGELAVPVLSVPVSLQATLVHNVGARDDLGDKLNKGYQTGAIVGKAKARNTWEIAYFNKWLEQDATIADVADADFGDGGTNRKGHISWIAYAPHDWMVVQIKNITADVITKSQAPSVDAGTANRGEKISRWQFDVLFKF